MAWKRLEVARKTVSDAVADGTTRLAAAVAFYAVLSLAPLLLLSLWVTRLIFGVGEARDELATAVEAFAGSEAASALQNLIELAAEGEGEAVTTLFGAAVMLLGASGVFYQLKIAMNIIWDVPEDRKGKGLRHFFRMRIWGIATAAIAIVFVLSTVFATSALAHIANVIPEARWGDATIWRLIAFLFTTFLYALLFTATYRFMPDLELRWRHVWKGGVLAAFAASVGQYLIGAYVARSVVASAYGAAGAIVVVLIWIYAMALVLFFGAELTQVLSRDDVDLARQRRERQREERHQARKPLDE